VGLEHLTARFAQTLRKPGNERLSAKLMDHARGGAEMPDCVSRVRCSKHLQRTMRPTAFAMSLKAIRRDRLFVFQNARHEVKLFCRAAVYTAASRPLVGAENRRSITIKRL
jgi:hypothetical protein